MIDIENIVVSTVQDAVLNAFYSTYPNLAFYSEYVEVPSEFPCVTLVESDNSSYVRSQDDSLHDNHVSVMYECNVYTSNLNGKKLLAKQIADVVDNAMQNMKFTRTFRYQIPNQDRSIYRITMRYTAVVAAPITDNGTNTYQMYRQ